MARSGHCVDLMSQRMGREDCCSTGGASTSWSQEDMDAGELFFWRVLGGGVPCQACKETCAGVTCGEGKRCVMRKGRPKCACAPDCRHGKGSSRSQRGPVCGSDGRSYRSACRLRKRSCRKKSSNLSIAYYGHCERSCERIQCPDGKQCLLDQRLTPHCVKCRRNCPLLIPASSSFSSSNLSSSSAALAAATARHRMVCGVDGVTYLSACHLREAACRRGKAIPMAYKGRCKSKPLNNKGFSPSLPHLSATPSAPVRKTFTTNSFPRRFPQPPLHSSPDAVSYTVRPLLPLRLLSPPPAHPNEMYLLSSNRVSSTPFTLVSQNALL
ncbi:hypothetical protein J437_LFUL003681 [Ladona fulva]|uniref:Kazal-like domain-containing protein n=1 Tax=Ladona fulva TaxID=123851 RepID=A0A8K0K002_LADFU|nr:hypothetical protein J437_LFUL003681 [Ladona fulva]